MLKASLEKWVDELQAQIDQVKRDVQSIPAPEPITPDVVGKSGNVEISVTSGDTSSEGTATITADLDLTNYDYYLNMHYEYNGIGESVCWDVLNKKIETSANIFVFSGVKSTSGTPSLFDVATLSATYSEGSIAQVITTPHGFIPFNAAKYVLIGIKKPAATTTSTRKKKSK